MRPTSRRRASTPSMSATRSRCSAACPARTGSWWRATINRSGMSSPASLPPRPMRRERQKARRRLRDSRPRPRRARHGDPAGRPAARVGQPGLWQLPRPRHRQRHVPYAAASRHRRRRCRSGRKELERNYHFSVRLLTNATEEDIIGALTDMRRDLGWNDNLLIYYAGHGWYDQDASKATGCRSTPPRTTRRTGSPTPTSPTP